MSVLIKGMEMPKTCEECALNYDSYACIKTGSRFFRDKDSEFDPFKARLEDCPLVPVPPHGRLIDADALDGIMVEQSAEEYNHHHAPRTWERALSCFRDYIKAAPTIIPAEEAT